MRVSHHITQQQQGCERCKTYVQGYKILHGTFDEKTKWSMFQQQRWRSAERTVRF